MRVSRVIDSSPQKQKHNKRLYKTLDSSAAGLYLVHLSISNSPGEGSHNVFSPLTPIPLIFPPAPPCALHIRYSDHSLCAAAARFGIAALLTVAARWRGGRGELFSPDLFGSVGRFCEFLRLTHVVEQVRVRNVGEWRVYVGI